MRVIKDILVKEIRDNWGGLAFIILLMVGIVGFDVISPWPFKILIDNVLATNAEPIALGGFLSFLKPVFDSRYLLGFFAILIYFLSTFLFEIVTYLHGSFTKKVIKNITSDFSKRAFNNLQFLAIGFYKKQKIGDYVYRLSYDVDAIGEFLEDGLLPLFTSGLYLVVTVAIMMLINFQLALLALAVLPVLAFGLYSFNTYITHATKRSETFNSTAYSFIEEALTHLKVIQAFSQERRESHRFASKTETSLSSDVAVYQLDFLVSLLIGIVIAISYSIVILYGIRAVFAGTLTTGLLVVFIFYLDNLTSPILSVIDAAMVTKQSYVKIARMRDFFSEKTHLEYHRSGALRTIDDASIRFDRVTVRGDKRGKDILRGASFNIADGQRTVIVGANGSGKTSIVNLIMRFIEKPTRGKVFLGGTDIADYDVTALRDSIAFVPQEITLFDDTIASNIMFGNQGASHADMRRAARLADADTFIERLPGKFGFKVGELGEFLSGGQRQKIMLARALMKRNAKILLFDETLSALDPHSRGVILHNLYDFSRGKTTIIVSNIFDVVTGADHIIVTNKGKIVYTGSARRLPRESSLYTMIENSQ